MMNLPENGNPLLLCVTEQPAILGDQFIQIMAGIKNRFMGQFVTILLDEVIELFSELFDLTA
jgi:hypothetical protein